MGVTASDLDDVEGPVVVKAHGVAARLVRQEAQQQSLPVTPGFRLTPNYASLSERQLDVKLPPLGTLDDTFVVKLPPGIPVVSVPPNAHGESPFGSYSVSVEQQPAKVVVHSRLTVKAVTVRPDQYAAWKQFCADADAALTPRLVIGSP